MSWVSFTLESNRVIWAMHLDGLIDQDRAFLDLWRRLVVSLAYPVLLFALTTLLLIAALFLVVQPMRAVFEDFGTELPGVTEFWIRMSDELPFAVVSALAIGTLVLLAIRLIGGAAMWDRFLAGIPLFGPLIHLASVSQMLRLLEIMLSHQLPLPEALRLTASGARSANMRNVSMWLAKGCEAGVPLADLMEATLQIPSSVVPVVRWGEANDSLGEAMRSAYELLEGRIRLQGSLVGMFLSPLILIFIGTTIGSLIIAMFLPLVSLVQNLM